MQFLFNHNPRLPNGNFRDDFSSIHHDNTDDTARKGAEAQESPR